MLVLKTRTKYKRLSAITCIMTIASSSFSRSLLSLSPAAQQEEQRKNHHRQQQEQRHPAVMVQQVDLPFVVDAYQGTVHRTVTTVRRGRAVSPSNRCYASTTTTTTTKEEQPQLGEPQRYYHLVLVGGGHAHVQVVKALADRPEYLKVTLIDRQRFATYSGTVPGCIAGLYDQDETRIDIYNLATNYAGIDFVDDAVVDIDCDAKLVYLQRQPQDPIPFDVISLDIGSTTRDFDTIAGAAQHAIPTRPIDQLIDRLQSILPLVRSTDDDGDDGNSSHSEERPRFVVIGGGVAGIELSMAVSARFLRTTTSDQAMATTPTYTTTLLDAGEMLLPSEHQLDRKGQPDAEQTALQGAAAVNALVVHENELLIEIRHHEVTGTNATSGAHGPVQVSGNLNQGVVLGTDGVLGQGAEGIDDTVFQCNRDEA